MTALHWLSIEEVGKRYRTGALAPRAYVEHLIARVRAHDGKLGAFLKLDADAALRDADRAGDELRAGRDRGALHGIPVGIKDIVAIAGDVTTADSRVHDPAPARADSFVVTKLRHAGAIFMGAYSSESLGDYCAGPNHVLPTSRTARFSSPLGVPDFQKRSSIIKVSSSGATSLGRIAAALARAEGLEAHARSADFRIDPSPSTRKM